VRVRKAIKCGRRRESGSGTTTNMQVIETIPSDDKKRIYRYTQILQLYNGIPVVPLSHEKALVNVPGTYLCKKSYL
jgi:hypothetical protein